MLTAGPHVTYPADARSIGRFVALCRENGSQVLPDHHGSMSSSYRATYAVLDGSESVVEVVTFDKQKNSWREFSKVAMEMTLPDTRGGQIPARK